MDKKHNIRILLAILIVIGFVSAQVDAPNGDYGDAPDRGMLTSGFPAQFPVLYSSSSGRMGGHTLVVGEEMIGTTVSAETDADDPADPDGIQNLVNTDKDDKIFVQIVPVSIPAPARFAFEVTIDGSAPEGERYVNILVDLNKNGTWDGTPKGNEWVVKNKKVNIAPGKTEWVTTDWFNWGTGRIMPTGVWTRIALTREPITSAKWWGEGEFRYGEIQDHIIELNFGNRTKGIITNRTNKTKPFCGNGVKEGFEQCDGKDDAACPGKCNAKCRCPGGGGKRVPPKKPGEPGPRKGPCTTPVAYHALVINAGDNKKRKQGQDSADDMFELLGQQGYDTGQYLAPNWDKEVGNMPDNGVTQGGYSSLAGIEEAIKNLGKKVKCVDRVMIYIIGHGLKKGGKKYGNIYPSGGIILQGKDGGKEVLTPEQLDEWLSMYLPACSKEDCKTPNKSCHVSVVVESCHSGNFMSALSKDGRTVAVSSGSSEVAYFGVNGKGNSHGGDYTNGYVKDMNSPSTADTNKDGYVSVAEAHKSATDKLSQAAKWGKKQTPDIKSSECECLPLICGPKCGDGNVDKPGEECDYSATPNGCPEDQTCNKECYCEYTETPENGTVCTPNEVLDPGEDCDPLLPGSCPEGQECRQDCTCEPGDEITCTPNEVVDPFEECDPTAFPNGCPSGQSCEDCECIGEDIVDTCPPNMYTEDECEAKLKPNQICVYDVATGCSYLQSVCNRGEYIDENCDGDCDEGEDCLVSDEDVPCYTCTTLEAICEQEGTYGSQEDCEADCSEPDYCDINEANNCWDCVEVVTCEEKGKYSSRSACEDAGCIEPDVCEDDPDDCWDCKEFSCPSGTYEDASCDGRCHQDEVCLMVDESGPCYDCLEAVCPDLRVRTLNAHVSRSASTHCVNNECTTDCSLDAYIDFTIKNFGSGASGASSASASISPNVGTNSESIGALAAGAESGSVHSTFTKSDTVGGSGLEACRVLNWWGDTYTATVVADSGGAVAECDENNNEQSVTTQQS